MQMPEIEKNTHTYTLMRSWVSVAEIDEVSDFTFLHIHICWMHFCICTYIWHISALLHLCIYWTDLSYFCMRMYIEIHTRTHAHMQMQRSRVCVMESTKSRISLPLPTTPRYIHIYTYVCTCIRTYAHVYVYI